MPGLAVPRLPDVRGSYVCSRQSVGGLPLPTHGRGGFGQFGRAQVGEAVIALP
jgi:hypothetical protein